MEQSFGLVERMRELVKAGRNIDAYEYEKGAFGNHRFDLFEKGQFIESFLLYCRDEDIPLVKQEIDKELA